MKGTARGCAAAASTLALAFALARAPSARAIGLEGPAGADQRVGTGLAAGFDQVGGLGRDGFPFGEVFGHADVRLWRWLALGAGLSLRGDVADYNYALGRWRGRSTAITAQVSLGYDGPRFHLSAGSWLFGNDRDGRDFRAALLPYGVVRLRAGSLDRWHFLLHIADGAPFTAEGAGTGVRMLLGAPPRGAHRLAAGVYTSLGEKTVGLALTDELASPGLAGANLRIGGLAGVNWDNPGSRPELTVFAGLVW